MMIRSITFLYSLFNMQHMYQEDIARKEPLNCTYGVQWEVWDIEYRMNQAPLPCVFEQ